jgi:methionine sulfoxide reductase heme-binding subunit
MATLRTTVLPLTAAGVLLLCGVPLALQGINEESLRQVIRLTAGSSLLLFALAFSASSLNQLLPGGRWRNVLQARRRIGLAFALSHSFHLLAIVALVEVAFGGDYSELGNLTGGAIVYLFIYLMALTSNDAAFRLLGARQWKGLHKLGAYLIWGALTASYVGGLFEVGIWYYWIYVPLAVSLLPIRIVAFRSKRRTV